MRFGRGGLAALAVAALVVGACSVEEDGGSADDGDGSGNASADEAGLTAGGGWDDAAVTETVDDLDCGLSAPDPDRGVTDTSVRVGGLLTESGPTTALFADAELGARARFERANAEGGVHGRTIDFVGAEDDGLESSRQVDAARRLVSDEVFAVVPLISAIPSWNDTLCEAVVPTFGWGITAEWCGTTIAFAITGCIVNPEPAYQSFGTGSIVEVLGEEADTIALLGNEDESARLGVDLLSEAFERNGFETVYAENLLSPTVPVADPSPIVNDILTSNDGGQPAIVYQISDFANTSTMTQALVAAGYEGDILNAVGYDPRLATFEAFEGSYTTLQWMPFESTDVPFVEQMAADLDGYAPDTPKSLPTASGYIAADLFLAGLEATGPDLTVDSFLETLNDDWVYPTPDFKGEVRFPANHVAAVPCGTLVVLEDQEYSAASPITCSATEAR